MFSKAIVGGVFTKVNALEKSVLFVSEESVHYKLLGQKTKGFRVFARQLRVLLKVGSLMNHVFML